MIRRYKLRERDDIVSFSVNMGFRDESPLQVDCINERLRNRIHNYFFSIVSTDAYSSNYDLNKRTLAYIVDKMGYRVYDYLSDNIKTLEFIFRKKDEWYYIYDVLEYLIEYRRLQKNKIDELNMILKEERSGYRYYNNCFVKITNEGEMQELIKAQKSPYESVNVCMKKAAQLYSDRQNPDYENSIKESISAVEAMCCIITGLEGREATLGKALKKLEDSGISIHKSLESGFIKLYGYACDESGIRHAGIDFAGAPEEDARYMMISCSAFINYLIDKYNEIKIIPGDSNY